MAEIVFELLEEQDEAALNGALEQCLQVNPLSYDVLASIVEACCETRFLEHDKQLYDALLICAPVLVWSRYHIPSGTLPDEILTNLATHMGAHILSAQARLSLVNVLFSPEQLPENYSSCADLLKVLIGECLRGEHLRIDGEVLRETLAFLSDTRYVLGVVLVPRGAPIFRWQEDDGGTRAQALAQWQKQGLPCLTPFMPACVCEALLPQSYHEACREGDRQARAFSIKASVDYLQTTLNVPAAGFLAVVAPFQQERIEEYRIGFCRHDSDDVLHGVVWPLLDGDDENGDVVAQIEAVLKSCGVHDIRVFEQRFPLEYCDDCGAPMYPSPEGEPVHAEMPEDSDNLPRQLH